MASILKVDELKDVTEATTLAMTPTGVEVNGVGLFGIGQTWQDVTGSRALGVTYTNNTGKSITAVISCNGGAAGIATAIVDGLVIGTINPQTQTQAITFIIPGGSTYSFTAEPFISWYELR